MLSLEGKQLGNYDIIRRIRVGGMGAVYEGRQRTAFDRRVAIKVILGDYAADPDMRRRFAREAKTVARLQHPHILPLIEFGDEQGILYLVMPFIEGGTLTSYLRHNLPGLGEVSTMYQQMLDAVEYAHEHNLIHRDIKSSNVLLELRRNMPPYAYLADFGLVRAMRPGDASQVGKPIPLEQVPGTPHYMAPEQTMGIVTSLTDIYALGVLLYQMLTGNLPYNDPDEVRVIEMHLHDPIPSPGEHDASIPPELDEVVKTAMAKLPEERYPTVAALRVAFLAALQGTSVPLPVKESVKPNRAVKPTIQLEPEDQPPGQSPAAAAEVRPNKHAPGLRRPPADPPRPIIMHQRPRGGDSPLPVAVSETRERADHIERPERLERITDERSDRIERPYGAERARHRVRITDEPATSRPPRQRRRFLLLLALVALLLLAMLLIPRVFGASIFPSDLALPGMTNAATVRITPKSSNLENAFLLTASPQIKSTDLNARAIPDRLLTVTEAAETIITTTGINKTQGQQAHGAVLFVNTSPNAIPVSKNLILTTGNGIQVQLTQDASIPPKQDNQPGRLSVPAVAVQTGQAGNISANAIIGACCTPTLYTSNPAPFTGGVDDATTHFFSQADLDGSKNNLLNKLKQQLGKELQQQLKTGEIMAGQPDYKIVMVNTNDPVNATADKVQISIKAQGVVPAYQKNVADAAALALLNSYAQKKLGNSYQLQGQITVNGPDNTEPGRDGIVYLTLKARGTWTYIFSDAQIKKLRLPIKGATADVAKTYLAAQPGVDSVDIRLPFGTDHLPTNTDDINILLSPPPVSANPAPDSFN
ncbi:serine/threonine protein kinase [Dictyobacter kobayashii]|uniref:non-specific serine/threonine protein kinase n=1 Tax=Dictyobacter kobayashii TaxID=2014872 RepID=A0A402ARL3_9CHLR|nr:serine/threonine-protein kinase [Dictyobacter kobayashii]GCE21732.1 hypothetical protein KDK_55320 [Dictyobacter kobayashii]